MAQLADELRIGWKHLDALASGVAEQDGWRAIAIGARPNLELRAGRRSAGGEEALLVGFRGMKPAQKRPLPESEGFIVEQVQTYDNNVLWIAVTRKRPFTLDLFWSMTADVASKLQVAPGESGEQLFGLFVSRVRDWQEFMRKISAPMSAEEELGLVGEIRVLIALLDLGLSAAAVLQAWEGPSNGIHDFVLGTGAIEVKCSVADAGFSAKIHSLEQLDDTVHKPLFMAAVRLRNDSAGWTLPQHLMHVRERISDDAEAERLLRERLWSIGYSDEHVAKYARTFSLGDIVLFEVREGFPRLIHGTVPLGVRKALYEIELDHVAAAKLSIADAVQLLGAI
jgi:hypothetical protein